MLHVITGPPCAGKTTHAHQHRAKTDLVIDLDALAHALGYPTKQLTWNDPHPAIDLGRLLRTTAIGYTTKHAARLNTWLIDADPNPTSLRIWQRAGATLIHLDPGPAVCHERARADNRDEHTHQRIDAWYAGRRTPPPTPPATALGLFDR